MRFRLTEGSWQSVSHARSDLSASLSNKTHPWRRLPQIWPLSHSERSGRWGTSPEGPPMMRARARGCVHNVTVLLLSLMSHQCTQRASVFSKPEYINTSVYQVILRLWGGRRLELLRATFLFHIFRKEHRLILVCNYVYTFIFRFLGLIEASFLKQLFRFSYWKKKQPKKFWHSDSGRFSHLCLQQILSDLFAMDWRRTRASAQAGTNIITVQR